MARPVHEIRIGLIKARIWRKHTRSGKRHNVSVVRLYRNGDVWKESTRFGRDDLPLVRLVLDHAHTWIYANGQKASPPRAHHATARRTRPHVQGRSASS
jgi:hypothetical protein